MAKHNLEQAKSQKGNRTTSQNNFDSICHLADIFISRDINEKLQKWLREFNDTINIVYWDKFNANIAYICLSAN